MSTHKKVGLLDAVLIQTNGMIGAGIIGIPPIIIQSTGAFGLSSFFICIILVISMTYALGILSVKYGGRAWCYRFPSLWGSHLLGILSASFYIIGLHVALGFVCQQAGIWLYELLPFFSAKVFSILSVLFLTGFIYAGKEVSSLWQYGISFVIVLSVLTTSVICFAQFDQNLFFSKQNLNIEQMLLFTPVVLFSFMGFETVTSMYALIKNPRKNVLLGGLTGVLIVGILYLIFSTSVLSSIPKSSFDENTGLSLTKVIQLAFPKYAAFTRLIYFGGLFAILGTLHSMIWSVNSLIMTINEEVKSSIGSYLFNPKKINSHWFLCLSSVSILICSFLFKSSIILYSTVILIGSSYALSIMPLIKIKKDGLKIYFIYFVSLTGIAIMLFFSIRMLILYSS